MPVPETKKQTKSQSLIQLKTNVFFVFFFKMKQL